MSLDSDYVLLVEDTLTQALLYQHCFEKKGITTKVAKSAKKARELIKEKAPLLVVSDVNMPEEDGYQLCQSLKDDDTTCKIKVLLLSSALLADEIFDIVNSKADDFILKTMPAEVIADQIIRTLNSLKIASDSKDECSIQPVKIYSGSEEKTLNIEPTRAANLIYSLYQALCHRVDSV